VARRGFERRKGGAMVWVILVVLFVVLLGLLMFMRRGRAA
jgi:high-affinity Fe2+/Pb2+ permease